MGGGASQQTPDVVRRRPRVGVERQHPGATGALRGARHQRRRRHRRRRRRSCRRRSRGCRAARGRAAAPRRRRAPAAAARARPRVPSELAQSTTTTSSGRCASAAIAAKHSPTSPAASRVTMHTVTRGASPGAQGGAGGSAAAEAISQTRPGAADRPAACRRPIGRHPGVVAGRRRSLRRRCRPGRLLVAGRPRRRPSPAGERAAQRRREPPRRVPPAVGAPRRAQRQDGEAQRQPEGQEQPRRHRRGATVVLAEVAHEVALIGPQEASVAELRHGAAEAVAEDGARPVEERGAAVAQPRRQVDVLEPGRDKSPDRSRRRPPTSRAAAPAPPPPAARPAPPQRARPPSPAPPAACSAWSRSWPTEGSRRSCHENCGAPSSPTSRGASPAASGCAASPSTSASSAPGSGRASGLSTSSVSPRATRAPALAPPPNPRLRPADTTRARCRTVSQTSTSPRTAARCPPPPARTAHPPATPPPAPATPPDPPTAPPHPRSKASPPPKPTRSVAGS